MNKKNKFDIQHSILKYSLWIVCMQVILSGLAWLAVQDSFAIIEIMVGMLLVIILIFMERNHMRAFWGYMNLISIWFLMTITLIRLSVSLFSAVHADTRLFLALIIVSMVFELIVTFYAYNNKFDLENCKNIKILDANSGHWYAGIECVPQKNVRHPKGCSWEDIARLFIPIGPILGTVLYRTTNDKDRNLVMAILILVNSFILAAYVGKHISTACSILQAEEQLGKSISFYWSRPK